MKILIDADGCPVVRHTVELSNIYDIECIIVCDHAHVFVLEGAETIMVDTGRDSVDFALVNLVKPGDIVVTQDYGLATLCLSKKAQVINQNGLVYTEENIDNLLQNRYTSQVLRKANQRVKGHKKRTPRQTIEFKSALTKLLEK